MSTPARTRLSSRLIVRLLPHLPQKLVWLFSRRYIAGQGLDDAVRVCRALNARGVKTTVDHLGEFITRLDQASANRQAYLRIIDRLEHERIDGNYSLKPTSFGLLLDPEACYRNIREIAASAAARGNSICLDMEDSKCTDLELSLFRRLRQEFPRHVGLAVQAYLKRTLGDLRSLQDLHDPAAPLTFRLCKGIYVEPESIAFQDYHEINAHYLEDLEYLFRQGMYPAIATHDRPLVEGALRLIEKYQVPKDRYEFQMLYGVTPELRQSLVARGHAMRVYVPFGQDWFAYSTRRLKENPALAAHIIKALFVRG